MGRAVPVRTATTGPRSSFARPPPAVAQGATGCRLPSWKIMPLSLMNEVTRWTRGVPEAGQVGEFLGRAAVHGVGVGYGDGGDLGAAGRSQPVKPAPGGAAEMCVDTASRPKPARPSITSRWTGFSVAAEG
ncbi:hypothetical protein [Streptomyces sp. NPDC056730]|uniref:hypothetical protein n=1 Tax=unclassified Streptomyces TaxID=2593676 RepID=UPI0036C967DB